MQKTLENVENGGALPNVSYSEVSFVWFGSGVIHTRSQGKAKVVMFGKQIDAWLAGRVGTISNFTNQFSN